MTKLREQTAAMPLKQDSNGRISVLMVTSRETRRWVVPKGWLEAGTKPWRAAELEALEEAGAEGFVATESIGEYHYDKRLDDGTTVPCRVRVYPMVVGRLKRRWKERGERKRRWFSPKAAAKRVDEPELAALLESLGKTGRAIPFVRQMLKAS